MFLGVGENPVKHLFYFISNYCRSACSNAYMYMQRINLSVRMSMTHERTKVACLRNSSEY